MHRTAFLASIDNVEVRDSGNGEDFTLTGHAAVFDRWSEDLSVFGETFRERLAEGAFSEVLKGKPDVRLLFNHDGMALARTKSGTLELSEDSEGLRVWAQLAPTTYARDLRMAMQRGDIDQMSFAFTVAEDEWREDHDEGIVERTITRIGDLFDVSVVTYPAYPDTDAAIREMRSAADAGKISLRAAEAETDPPGEAETGTSTDVAEAETDPPGQGESPLAEFKRSASERATQEREAFLRLTKELAR